MTVRFTPQHPTAAAEMEWDAWGTADRRKELGEGVRTLLRQALGVDTERELSRVVAYAFADLRLTR